MNIHHERARGICDINVVFARKLPNQPAVDRAKQDIATLGVGTQARATLSSSHLNFGPEKYVAIGSPVRALKSFGIAFQRTTDAIRSGVLPDDGVMHGLAGPSVPDHGRLALIGHTDGGDVPGNQAGSAESALDNRCGARQISSASCSTQPACGKSWRCSI